MNGSQRFYDPAEPEPVARPMPAAERPVADPRETIAVEMTHLNNFLMGEINGLSNRVRDTLHLPELALRFRYQASLLAFELRQFAARLTKIPDPFSTKRGPQDVGGGGPQPGDGEPGESPACFLLVNFK